MRPSQIAAMAALVGSILCVAPTTEAAFLGIQSTGGISRNTNSNLDGSTNTFYSGAQMFVNYNLRVPQSSESIFKFDLGALAGKQITSATLSFNIHLAQSTGASTVILYVSGLGSSTTVGSQSDFGAARGGGGSVNLGPYISSPVAVNLDQTAFIRSLVSSQTAAVGYDFSVFSPSNVAFNSLVLNVYFEPTAVPEPSALVLCSMAGVMGAGFMGVRRRWTAAA